MNTIPVWQTFVRSVEFAFGRYFSILGVVWLPLLILFGCEYLVIVPLIKNMGVITQFLATHPRGTQLPPELMVQPRFAGLLNLVTYLVGAWITIGVTKEALGLRTGTKLVYLSLGSAELLYVASQLVLIGLVVAAVLAIVLAALVVGGTGAALYYGGAFSAINPHTLAGIGAGAMILFGIAVFGAFVYCLIRLTFLLAPATVAENRFALLRSWELSKGHFWQLFGIALLIALVFLMFEIAIIVVVAVPVVMAVVHEIPHMAKGDVQGMINFGMKVAGPYVGLAVVVAVAVAPVFTGLSCGASVFAYRALVPGKAE